MATYTLQHSSIACLMTCHSDQLPQPLELIRADRVTAINPRNMEYDDAAYEALPALVRCEVERRFFALFAIEPPERRTGPVEAFRAVPLTIEA